MPSSILQGGDPSLRSSTDDPGFVAAITQDSAGPEDDDEGDGDWDAGDEDDSEDGGVSGGAEVIEAISNSIPPELADLRSALVATEDRGRKDNCQFHKENKELKLATLNLERERLADDKARRDREEQALEEHRRWERRMKEEEMECRRREVSAKEDASVVEVARLILPSVSGDVVEAYKKAIAMYESHRRQRGGDENS
ncbi:hypothetical protein D1P53_004627 [Cryptococcus gattii VGV]|nr:hypothetical protein D1P53_004627 [Cryptococcus gattii VGV]